MTEWIILAAMFAAFGLAMLAWSQWERAQAEAEYQKQRKLLAELRQREASAEFGRGVSERLRKSDTERTRTYASPAPAISTCPMQQPHNYLPGGMYGHSDSRSDCGSSWGSDSGGSSSSSSDSGGGSCSGD